MRVRYLKPVAHIEMSIIFVMVPWEMLDRDGNLTS